MTPLLNSGRSMDSGGFQSAAAFPSCGVEMRWVDTCFPFTNPSFELEIYFQDQWMEVLGCGVTEQEILKRSGRTDNVAWAFGLGLERLAMVLFDIPDIRLFWSTDERFTSQFYSGRLWLKFKPFSKYPPCYKDMSFWISDSFTENNLCEVVRGIAGDLAEEVEVQISKLYCVNRAVPTLPINIEDAARSEVEIEQALEIFRQFLLSEGFVGIHTPKLIGGSSEGGSAVFTLDYKGQPACLAQSPQLHKQMAISGDFGRVFEIGPVFRAEDSFTHRHLCEFTGLDVEMEIKEHYSEVMDIVDRLFVAMFDSLNEKCKKELEAIGRQYPFEPLKYLRKTLRLTFAEGVQMLKEAGVEVDPLGDLNTESERKLGQLVAEKYGTEFYILHKYPQAVRPFYTMPFHDNPSYSNSFDVFIRGEEIISGAQRIHVPEFLEKRAGECGIDVKTISTYIDSFRYGAPPHGGFGVGLERVVMLFCALNNIRKTSLFPRDPQRLAP